MTQKEILKLIKWDEDKKTLFISDEDSTELDLSIHVTNDIKGDVRMKNIGGYNIQKNITGHNSQWNIGGSTYILLKSFKFMCLKSK